MANTAVALLRAMRPHHWTKNLFVLAPSLFEHKLDQPKNLRALAAFGVFCLLSSGVYLLNDVLDREADRVHPEKRRRPVAAGELPVAVAVTAAIVLLALAFGWVLYGLE